MSPGTSLCFEGVERLSSVARNCLEDDDPIRFLERSKDAVAARLLRATLVERRAPRVAIEPTVVAARAVSLADEAGERTANTGHVLAAALESAGVRAGDSENPLVDLAELRKHELLVRGHGRVLTDTARSQAPPDRRVASFAQAPVEIRRVLALLRELQGDDGVTTWRLLSLLVQRLPRQWDWFLSTFGMAVEDIASRDPPESGRAWVHEMRAHGKNWLTFAAAERPGTVALSLPCAESLWRALAIANSHGVLWYPDLLAITSLGIPEAATRAALMKGCPRGLDLAWAGFAHFGHTFEVEHDIMSCPIDVLERPGTGSRFVGSGELDSWILDAECDGAVSALLGSERPPRERATCLRGDDGLTAYERQAVLGVRFETALLQRRYPSARDAAVALSHDLRAEGCVAAAARVESVADALAGAATDRVADNSPSTDDLEAGCLNVLRAGTLTELGEAFRACPDLLGGDWDQALFVAPDAGLPPLVDERSGNRWMRGGVIHEVREVARKRGLSWALNWVGSQSEDQLIIRYGVADELESHVRQALDRWVESPKDRAAVDELVKLLRLGALVGPPALAARHGWMGLKVLSGFAEMTGDGDLLSVGLDLARIGRVHLTHGEPSSADVAAQLTYLRWVAHALRPQSDHCVEAATALGRAISMAPGPDGLVDLLARLGEVCLWPTGPGVERAEDCLAIAVDLETAAGTSSEVLARAASAIQRSKLGQERPLEVARQALETALARCRSRDRLSDSDVVEWTIKTGLLSDEPHEIEAALAAADWLGTADRAWVTAKLLHRKFETGLTTHAEAHTAAREAWRQWAVQRSIPDALELGRIRVRLAEGGGSYEDLLAIRRDVLELARQRLGELGKDRELTQLSRHLNGFLSTLARAFADSGREREAVVTMEFGRGLLLDSWRGAHFRDVEQIEDDLEQATADGVVVYLSSYESDSAAYVVRGGDAVERIRLDVDREQLLAYVVDFAAANLPDAPPEALGESVHAFGAWLWLRAIGPLVEHPIEPGTRVCFIPLGLFGPVPLQIAWEPSAASADGRRYPIDVWQVSFAPSVGFRANALRRRKPLERRRVVAVAPEGGGPFPELQYASREMLEAASRFDQAEILPGEQARLEHLERALSAPHDVFHFAGHGVSLPEEGRQLLILGEAHAIDVSCFRYSGWQTGRLAVASACQSAIGDPTKPDEGLSVATALVAVGYVGAIGNQWPVSDLATAVLFAEFYRRLHDGDDPNERLRDAQLWLRHSTAEDIRQRYMWTRPVLRGASHRPFEDPTFWAGATYYGA